MPFCNCLLLNLEISYLAFLMVFVIIYPGEVNVC